MKTLHILVVDDELYNREVAEAILASAGHRVTTCENGAQALALCEAIAFDAVLMDARMPVMDGLDTIRALRAHARTRAMPVIFMSGSILRADEWRILDAGGDDVVRKPYRRRELLNALARVLVARGVLSPAEAVS
jgi:CheY-like chemotaxis protein